MQNLKLKKAKMTIASTHYLQCLMEKCNNMPPTFLIHEATGYGIRFVAE